MTMSTVKKISISSHTTSSAPRPHIEYTVTVTLTSNEKHAVNRRYSEFVSLHSTLGDSFDLPPKRFLVTSFVPSAWVDDALIAERKSGLSKYLSALLSTPEYKSHTALLDFLNASKPGRTFDLEDALPSTLGRKAALQLRGQTQDFFTTPVAATATSNTPIAASYYPDWASITPSQVDYSKFNIIFFAFATPSSSHGLSWDDGATSTLQSLVSAAHNSGYGTKVCLSIGGWGGCEYYSSTMSTAANRTTFINAIASAVSTYNLDGIDIDWEYPNSSGAGQPYSSADSANLLLFFTSLRSKLGSSKIISAAVTQLPWLGANGNPLTNVSAYAQQLNYVNIMNYDVNGASSTPGPNAPLGNLCGTSSQPSASAEAAYAQWTAAGFPASQLLLGLPLYGYVSQSTATTLTGSFKAPDRAVRELDSDKTSNAPHPGQAHPASKEKEFKAASTNLQSWWGQQIPFNTLVSSGALVKSSNGTYSASGGFTEGWDNCSDTPYLFNTSLQTVVTYDDTYSLGDKAAYAKSVGMAGCFTWSMDQDDGTTLQSVIRSNLGLS